MLKRIFDLHYHQAKNYPKSDALATKIDNRWVKTSTESFIQQANEVASGLLELGLKPGDKIALISNNRPEWHILDLGILFAGMINVPLYPTITPDDYAFIMNDAETKLCFVSDEEIFQKAKIAFDKVDSLEDIYCFDEIEGGKSWKDIKLLGKDIKVEKLKEIQSSIKEDDLATLIYTSGTTGRPKGVMLSHKNLVSNALASRERLPVTSDSNALSFLPLCHVYERMVTYMYIYAGTSIYYAESLDTIGENLKEVKPKVFTAVPRLLEKVYDKITTKGKELTGIKKALFFWAVNLGNRYEVNRKNGAWYEFQLSIANKLIFNKWREALGGNTMAVASGAAALQPRLARIFLAAKIPVMEGYGLTETSPVIAVNEEKNDGTRIGTVGRPLKDVEVRIADDGEIEVKGPNVMIGYYKDEEATKKAFTADGWLKTGDIGEMIEGQFLQITGRKKETFKTSGGKYISPALLENKLKESSFIEHIMVIGEGEKHPSAIIQPAFDFVKEWCKRKGIDCKTKEDIANNQQVHDRIMQDIEFLNKEFAQYEKVKRIILSPHEWTIDSNEMTPTMKVKRQIVMKNFKEKIEKLYHP